MQGRIVRTPLAQDDLFEIWDYIADDSEAAADRMLARIDVALTSLRDHPMMGRARPELAADIRSFPVGNHIIYFRRLPDGVEIVRVMSGYRDIGPSDMS